MPRIIITANAAEGIAHCGQFLHSRNPQAAKRAGEIIEANISLLATMPEAGRPVPGRPRWRELVIPFGSSGYIAVYRHEPAVDAVYLLAFRHQKEAGFI